VNSPLSSLVDVWSVMRQKDKSVLFVDVVYWIHFAVEEDWELVHSGTGKVLYSSPNTHPNHHLWKFAKRFPLNPAAASFDQDNDLFKWQLIDFDDHVRTRLMALLLNTQHTTPREVRTSSIIEEEEREERAAHELIEHWKLDEATVWRLLCV